MSTLVVKLGSYKLPDSDVSLPILLEIFDEGYSFSESSDYMKFVSSIASFSMLLTNSQYVGTSNYNDIIDWLNSTNLRDEYGFKSELIQIVEKAELL